MQLLRAPLQSGTGLGDPRLPGHLDLQGGTQQPLDAFQQATQHFSIGAVHVQRQGNHVVDHHVCRQLPLPNAASARSDQYRLYRRQREGFRHHPEADVIRDTTSFRELCKYRAISPLLLWVGQYSTEITLSEQYWG